MKTSFSISLIIGLSLYLFCSLILNSENEKLKNINKKMKNDIKAIKFQQTGHMNIDFDKEVENLLFFINTNLLSVTEKEIRNSQFLQEKPEVFKNQFEITKNSVKITMLLHSSVIDECFQYLNKNIFIKMSVKSIIIRKTEYPNFYEIYICFINIK